MGWNSRNASRRRITNGGGKRDSSPTGVMASTRGRCGGHWSTKGISWVRDLPFIEPHPASAPGIEEEGLRIRKSEFHGEPSQGKQ